MPSKKIRQRKPKEEHTHLAIRIECYEASVATSINHDVYAPQYSFHSHERAPLYEFGASLTITGIAKYPTDRAGDSYVVTLYGDDAPSRHLDRTLEDVQVRDEYGSPQYRDYRGRQIPVYEPPGGLGYLEKIKGEERWTAGLFVAPRIVSDMLVLLGHERALYLAIHERKENRTRWIQGLTLQTVDPEEE